MIKQYGLDLAQARVESKLQLQELKELCLEAYESSRLYKEKTKAFYDKMIVRKEFVVRQKVLLFNSHLRLMPGKFRSRREGPYVVTNVFPCNAVEL